jgi:proteic killer suppression protein
MIVSVKDKRLLEIAAGRVPKRFPADLVKAARRAFNLLQTAKALDDLRTPPGNRLEALRGDRQGQHSIRVNSQWRICFRWLDDGAHDVELVDYH